MNRALPTHLRSGSLAGTTSSAQSSQSSALQNRITEKKAELASLRELQALSAGLADQMEMLEKKLGTLSDGTEAVATVLANWGNVLRAIGMAAGKVPKPKESEEDEEAPPLPQTLVRIPTQHAGMIAQENAATGDGE